MKTTFKACLIDGAVGCLEVRYVAETEALPNKAKKLVVLSHPHPLHGGTMDNKVVTTMARAFHSLGYITVTYNFRGVGKSEGKYDSGVGEQDDLMAVIAWSKKNFAIEHVTLAGFSFGSYVSLKVQQRITIEALCTVAPPVGLYDISELNNVNNLNMKREGGGEISWTLIQGGQDEVVSAKDVINWALSIEQSPDIYWRNSAGHFFHGELVWLKKIILSAF